MEIAALVMVALGAGGLPAELAHVRAFLAAARLPAPAHRPLYHLAAPRAHLAHPAAFLRYRRQYHLFYQYHPSDAVRGTAAWGHAASPDLVHWAHYPPALLPRTALDRGGCLAGSALRRDGHLALFYTGRAPAAPGGNATVNVAVSADAVVFQKYSHNPVLRAPPPGAAELRDPKVWRFCDVWYMLLGASVAGRGALLRYVSPDMHSWSPAGVAVASPGDMGRAWGSPDLFELDGMCVVMLTARGVPPDGDRFRGPRQTGYVAGRFDCRAADLPLDLEISTATFEELDHGHDLQTARTTLAADGRRLLVASLGGRRTGQAGALGEWSGCLTLVRELRLTSGGRLLQAPAREVRALRGDRIEDAWYSPGEWFETGVRSFELLVNASSASYDAEVALEWRGARRYRVAYWAARGKVGVERGEGDERLADWAPEGPLCWRLFVDRGSVEVFVGAGEVVFSSRVAPRGAVRLRVGGEARLYLTQYKLKRSIGFDRNLTKYLKKHYLHNEP